MIIRCFIQCIALTISFTVSFPLMGSGGLPFYFGADVGFFDRYKRMDLLLDDVKGIDPLKRELNKVENLEKRWLPSIDAKPEAQKSVVDEVTVDEETDDDPDWLEELGKEEVSASDTMDDEMIKCSKSEWNDLFDSIDLLVNKEYVNVVGFTPCLSLADDNDPEPAAEGGADSRPEDGQGESDEQQHSGCESFEWVKKEASDESFEWVKEASGIARCSDPEPAAEGGADSKPEDGQQCEKCDGSVKSYVILLDTSKSMAKCIDTLASEAYGFVSKIKSQSEKKSSQILLTIISFNRSSQDVVRNFPISEETDINIINEKIKSLEIHSGTLFFPVLEKELQKQHKKILVVTDGFDNSVNDQADQSVSREEKYIELYEKCRSVGVSLTSLERQKLREIKKAENFFLLYTDKYKNCLDTIAKKTESSWEHACKAAQGKTKVVIYMLKDEDASVTLNSNAVRKHYFDRKISIMKRYGVLSGGELKYMKCVTKSECENPYQDFQCLTEDIASTICEDK